MENKNKTRERRSRGKGKRISVTKVCYGNQVVITNVYTNGMVETLINPP